MMTINPSDTWRETVDKLIANQSEIDRRLLGTERFPFDPARYVQRTVDADGLRYFPAGQRISAANPITKLSQATLAGGAGRPYSLVRLSDTMFVAWFGTGLMSTAFCVYRLNVDGTLTASNVLTESSQGSRNTIVAATGSTTFQSHSTVAESDAGASNAQVTVYDFSVDDAMVLTRTGTRTVNPSSVSSTADREMNEGYSFASTNLRGILVGTDWTLRIVSGIAAGSASTSSNVGMAFRFIPRNGTVLYSQQLASNAGADRCAVSNAYLGKGAYAAIGCDVSNNVTVVIIRPDVANGFPYVAILDKLTLPVQIAANFKPIILALSESLFKIMWLDRANTPRFAYVRVTNENRLMLTGAVGPLVSYDNAAILDKPDAVLRMRIQSAQILEFTPVEVSAGGVETVGVARPYNAGMAVEAPDFERMSPTEGIVAWRNGANVYLDRVRLNAA